MFPVIIKETIDEIECIASREVLGNEGPYGRPSSTVPAKDYAPPFCCPNQSDIPGIVLPAATEAPGDPELDLCRKLFLVILLLQFESEPG